MKNFISLFISVLALTVSHSILAHSEHDKARFVAPNGKDVGDCKNALRPCKTIGFAISQANKGDKVLVASGEFEINSNDELFYLKSSLVPIYGGYNRFDHFQSQSPQSNITTLTNVPFDMASELRSKGFQIISDGKSFTRNKGLKDKLTAYKQLQQRQSNEQCIDGLAADIFECNNVDLLSHFPLTEMSSNPFEGNDIWGHVDLNTGNEFAIMGIYDGIIVVDVTDPTSPKEVGTISGVNSSWRDVKVYQYFDTSINLWQAYAYATTEGNNGGVSIIDLNNLPNSVHLAEKNNAVSTSHNIYITNIDHSLNIALPNKTPSLQIVGTRSKHDGAFQNYSLADPSTIKKLSSRSYGSGYTHDGASIVIDDERSASDCGLSSESCTVFLDFNEREIKLWDITNPNDTKQLGTAEYDDVDKSLQYVHSGWGTENTQYILVHDEFDEQRGKLNTTVRIFSIEDLNNPVQVGQWTGPTRAIDHNGFVRGNRYYMSNYERGLTILDITDPANPVEVGFFDTYTPSNNANFNGAWGVYPFLPSGNILVSDINSGLYILQDNAKESAKGQFAFTSKAIDTEQGVTLSLNVERNGADLSEAVSVSYQVIQGSAEDTSDFVIENSTLAWSANDNESKEISIEINPDTTNNEFPENFFVRLYNPQNGATLGENSYTTINIAGIPDAGTGSFSTNEVTVSENSGEYSVEVNRIGSTSGTLTFDYFITAIEASIGSDVEDNSGQISWADGENETKTITINLLDDADEEENERFTLSLLSVNNARIGSNGEITITIADDDKNEAPTVTLSENFQVNTGQTVNLTASATDSNNDDMTYLWTQTSGTNITLTNADTLSASFTAPTSAETLIFDFTATDFRGASTTATITISIVAPTEVVTVTSSSSSSGGGSTTQMALFGLILLLLRRKTGQIFNQ